MDRTAPPFRAVIFDMDGVVTDSEPAFYAAINDILARYGKSIDMEAYAQLVGGATPLTWETLIQMKDLPASLEELLEAYEEPLMRRLREPRPPLPGAKELIEKLRAGGVPIGLCTASYSHWVDAILDAAGLSGMFDAVSTADMVAHTKPDPAPYLLAARKLGVPPRDCIAIEDSVSGLTSAMRAGTYVVQLRATETSAPPLEGADLLIASLDEFPLTLIRSD